MCNKREEQADFCFYFAVLPECLVRQINSFAFPVAAIEVAYDLVHINANSVKLLAYASQFFHWPVQGDILVEEFDWPAGEDAADDFPNGVAVAFLAEVFQLPVLLLGDPEGDGPGEEFLFFFCFSSRHNFKSCVKQALSFEDIPFRYCQRQRAGSCTCSLSELTGVHSGSVRILFLVPGPWLQGKEDPPGAIVRDPNISVEKHFLSQVLPQWGNFLCPDLVEGGSNSKGKYSDQGAVDSGNGDCRSLRRLKDRI